MKMIGVVTVDGRWVGRRNRLHVPHDIAASALREVDVVDSDGEVRDRPQLGAGGIQQLGVDQYGRICHHGVRAGNGGEDLVALGVEASEPHLGALARDCARAGYRLDERLPIYEEFIDRPGFVDPAMREPIGKHGHRRAGKDAE